MVATTRCQFYTGQNLIMYYVYVLETIVTPKKRYVGFTEDLRSRLRDHNSGKNISTATSTVESANVSRL